MRNESPTPKSSKASIEISLDFPVLI